MSEAKCPRCGGDNYEYVPLFGNFDVGCCLECGYVFEIKKESYRVDYIVWLFSVAVVLAALWAVFR